MGRSPFIWGNGPRSLIGPFNLPNAAPASAGLTIVSNADGTSDWDAISAGISGPVSSTDNAIARWDGVGGDTLQDSAAQCLDTTGAILFPGTAADAANMIQGVSAGQGVGYNSSASRVVIIMQSAAKMSIGNTFVAAAETFLANESAQSATVPAIATSQDTNTGISWKQTSAWDELYFISGGVNIATLTPSLFAHSVYMQMPNYTDSNRGSAGTAGRVIFNTDDGNLNIDDGTNWILPDGTTT